MIHVLPDGWLSVNDAAAYYGVSRATVYRRIETGDWPCSRLPGSSHLRFSPEDLLAISQQARAA